MNFLVDAHLPRRIIKWLTDAGYGTIHTLDLADGTWTTDEHLNEVAVQVLRIVITKDADFVNSPILSGRPAKLLLISIGNITNRDLESLMVPLIPDTESNLSSQDKPFRRILSNEEHTSLHVSLIRKWGNWYGGCVDPKARECDVVTLHVQAMKEPESYELLRAFLIEQCIRRVFELREHGDGFEIDTNIAGFTYNGAEGFWTNGDLGWLVYASHESSITFGSNWLVEKMRGAIPDFDRYIYKGWDLASYV